MNGGDTCPYLTNIPMKKIKDEDDQTGCVAKKKQANSNSTPARFRNPGS